MILKFGLDSATTRHYLAEIHAWLRDIVRRIGDLGELEDLLESNEFRRREVGLVAQERFQCLAQLWKNQLLGQEFDPWFQRFEGD